MTTAQAWVKPATCCNRGPAEHPGPLTRIWLGGRHGWGLEEPVNEGATSISQEVPKVLGYIMIQFD
jgi:hypothetical protein